MSGDTGHTPDATGTFPVPLAQHGYGKGCPIVRGVCPSCGVRALFLGASGYVTCASPTCGNPSAPSEALDPDWQVVAPPSVCKDCHCHRGDHNNDEAGSGCTSCGDCEGWR